MRRKTDTAAVRRWYSDGVVQGHPVPTGGFRAIQGLIGTIYGRTNVPVIISQFRDPETAGHLHRSIVSD
jgi:hypothetical protein